MLSAIGWGGKGVGVWVGVAVWLGVGVWLGVAVDGTGVSVAVGVGVGLDVSVGIALGMLVAGKDVSVAVAVKVGCGVKVAVSVITIPIFALGVGIVVELEPPHHMPRPILPSSNKIISVPQKTGCLVRAVLLTDSSSLVVEIRVGAT